MPNRNADPALDAFFLIIRSPFIGRLECVRRQRKGHHEADKPLCNPKPWRGFSRPRTEDRRLLGDRLRSAVRRAGEHHQRRGRRRRLRGAARQLDASRRQTSLRPSQGRVFLRRPRRRAHRGGGAGDLPRGGNPFLAAAQSSTRPPLASPSTCPPPSSTRFGAGSSSRSAGATSRQPSTRTAGTSWPTRSPPPAWLPG